MKKLFRPRVLVTTALLLLMMVVFLAAAESWSDLKGLFGPGKTIDETARILIHDEKFGMRAKEKAIGYGDAILPYLQKESKNFFLLNGRNSLWIADVLGAIQTDKSRAILLDLYSRENTLARLTGAVGLARHGALGDDLGEDSFLLTQVRNDPGRSEPRLAIIALGWCKNEKALPNLFAVLEKREFGYWPQADACDAVARIRSTKAIPVLRKCLKSSEFHALPNAFRSLLSLGDREAIPLTIARVTPATEEYNSGHIVKELEKVTGQSFGFDRARWQEWWKSVESSWKIPEKFRKPWDEQPTLY